MTYAQWIKDYEARMGTKVLGQCAKATQEMVETFPELIRVPGHVYPMGWGKRAHWWCVTPTGEIVDPTASQFPGGFAGDYEPFEPGTEVRVGRCMYCGEDLYATIMRLDEEPPHRTFCDDRCHDAMASEVGW